MAKRKSNSDSLTAVVGKVASYRRGINRAVWNTAMNQLHPELRQLLTEARGNPHVEVKVRRLIAALAAAEDLLHRLQHR